MFSYNTWHLIDWVCVTVVCTYLVAQLFAWRRLKGEQKRRSNNVSRVMLIVICLSDTIPYWFFYKSRVAYRAGGLVMGVAAIAAMVVLIRMLGESPVVADGQEAEPKLQSLNL